jgi:hypothetical protein
MGLAEALSMTSVQLTSSEPSAQSYQKKEIFYFFLFCSENPDKTKKHLYKILLIKLKDFVK